ncbi:MAG TPA: carbohydrate ABC transporter permease [Anaerolineales bacterium]
MKRKFRFPNLGTYLILTAWTLIVVFPLYTMIVNSFKNQRDIFRSPFGLPFNFTLDGYQNALSAGRFDLFFRNSIIVTVSSLTLIIILGSLAAYALARWNSRFSNLIYFFFILGLLIPIRLGTISIIQIIIALKLNNSLVGLIPIYVAMGIPIAILVITAFIRSLPKDLLDAAAIDGASEWQIYRTIILPLVRPALATVAIFNLIPIWNDFWFPLILIRQESNRTIPLGVTLLFGQYQTNWTNILSALSLATMPIIVLYLLMASQFIKGLTAGAIKG